jgi:hypothetical protein|tara:strand:+ start:870 stop:1145 length:276 start_codon:yes stop_codon:yes gene_type:complete
MALTKQIKVDKTEAVSISEHFLLRVRNRVSVIEDGVEISSAFQRFVLTPDSDVSKITDAVVLAQFQAVMTDEVKANYTAFKEAQEAEMNPA